MRDRIFLDSNILVYSSLEDNENKHNKIISLLQNIKGKEIFLSTQVINEVYVTLLKNGLDDDAIQKVLMEIIETYNISVITIEIIKKAWDLRKQYRYSYWDSLVLASASANNIHRLRRFTQIFILLFFIYLRRSAKSADKVYF